MDIKRTSDWIRLYKSEGPTGLLNSSLNRRYSKNLKETMVQRQLNLLSLEEMNNPPFIDRRSNQEALSNQIGMLPRFTGVSVSGFITPEHRSRMNSLYGMSCFIPVDSFL